MAGGEDSVRFEELHRSYHLICVFLIIVNQFPSATPWWMWPPWRTLLVPGYDHHTLAPTQPSHFGQLCRAVIYLVIIEISCKCQSLESNLVGVHVSIVFPPKACPPHHVVPLHWHVSLPVTSSMKGHTQAHVLVCLHCWFCWWLFLLHIISRKLSFPNVVFAE